MPLGPAFQSDVVAGMQFCVGWLCASTMMVDGGCSHSYYQDCNTTKHTTYNTAQVRAGFRVRRGWRRGGCVLKLRVREDRIY